MSKQQLIALISIVLVGFIITAIIAFKSDKVVDPTVTRLQEINDSLEKKIYQDGVIIETIKDRISSIKDTIYVYNNKTNTIIKTHNENVQSINYISNNGELIQRINSSIRTLDSINKSSGFFIHRDSNRTSLPYTKSN